MPYHLVFCHSLWLVFDRLIIRFHWTISTSHPMQYNKFSSHLWVQIHPLSYNLSYISTFYNYHNPAFMYGISFLEVASILWFYWLHWIYYFFGVKSCIKNMCGVQDQCTSAGSACLSYRLPWEMSIRCKNYIYISDVKIFQKMCGFYLKALNVSHNR